MLILGRTADDKGAQLETLVLTVLKQQGYKRVRTNVIGAGGNEIDIDANRESVVMGDVQVTPVICEAKAYAAPVSMPTWQKFLGKLFIERTKDINTVGILVALNGVNGNVVGFYKTLKAQDSALFVFEGTDLEALATGSGELAIEEFVSLAAGTQFQRRPYRVETAYYGGVYYWVVWWKHEEQYSIVDGRGAVLSPEEVERLRPALEESLPGALLANADAEAEAQARHDARLEVLGRLMRRSEVNTAENSDKAETIASLATEPFCHIIDGRLELLQPEDMDANAVSRLFLIIFENTVKVGRLSFMVGRHHTPFVKRLVEAIPALHAGFTLEESEAATLAEIAVLFPSVWVTIAQGNPMITTHRGHGEEVTNEAILDADRDSFWEAVISAVRSDYSNQQLRGLLYDYMDVAEIQSRTEFIVKSKTAPVGLPIAIASRDAVRQFVSDSDADPDSTTSDPPNDIGDEPATEATDPSTEREPPIFVLVRLLATVGEPWGDDHPDPALSLDV